MSIRHLIVVLLGVLLAALAFLWARPEALLDGVRLMERGRAGLDERVLTVEEHDLVYLRGGVGPPALWVHGFAADKDNWTRLAAKLSGDHDLIVPDLPGHGQSSRIASASYDIHAQVRRLHAFHEALGVGPVHLVGNSMGGHIATWYAVDYPDEVVTLTLIAPGGVTSPGESELSASLRRGLNPLLVQDVQDYDRLLDFLFVTPPYIPGPAKAYFAAKAVEHRAFNDKIWDDLHTHPAPLEPVLGRVRAPTLVLWGDSDRVLDPSAAAVFGDGIPGATVHILPATGHASMIETPETVAPMLLDLWRSHEGAHATP